MIAPLLPSDAMRASLLVMREPADNDAAFVWLALISSIDINTEEERRAR